MIDHLKSAAAGALLMGLSGCVVIENSTELPAAPDPDPGAPSAPESEPATMPVTTGDGIPPFLQAGFFLRGGQLEGISNSGQNQSALGCPSGRIDDQLLRAYWEEQQLTDDPVVPPLTGFDLTADAYFYPREGTSELGQDIIRAQAFARPEPALFTDSPGEPLVRLDVLLDEPNVLVRNIASLYSAAPVSLSPPGTPQRTIRATGPATSPVEDPNDQGVLVINFDVLSFGRNSVLVLEAEDAGGDVARIELPVLPGPICRD